jgi:hypothetical protein
MLGLTVLRSHHFSTFAGGVTLGIMMIPIAVRSTEEFLHAVPVNLREGGIELARQMGRSGQGIGRDPGPGAELAVVKTKDLEHLKPESAESFVRKLRTVWHQGEVRPPHRRQAARHWCTRSDPFETAKSRIHEQLSLTPEMGAKELFQRLQEGYPGQFSENQIRTLRRRVKQWRMDRAKRLILEAQSQLISPVRYEAAAQRKKNDVKMGSAQSRDLTPSGQNAFRGK